MATVDLPDMTVMHSPAHDMSDDFTDDEMPAVVLPEITGMQRPAHDAVDVINDRKWCTAFPPNLTSESDSQRFFFRAIFAVFSGIFRYRKLLPEECFVTSYITEKLKMKSFSLRNRDSLGIAILLKSASMAINDCVLDELALVTSLESNPNEAVEVFSFKVHYDGKVATSAELRTGSNGNKHHLAQIAFSGSNDVKDQLVMLLKSMQVLCVKLLKDLPENVTSNFRIAFRDDTPVNYHTPGYQDKAYFYNMSQRCQEVTVGHLRPGFHCSGLSCSSVFMDDAYVPEVVLKNFTDRLSDKAGYRSKFIYPSLMPSDTNNAAVRVEAPPVRFGHSANLNQDV